ncbi:MAG: thioredoxin [Candidatus Micrarchaeia archaeon]
MVIDINAADFEREVIKSDKPVVIDFWAEWCGPCRILSPIIDEVSNEYAGKVKFVKVNVDDNPQLAEKFSIMSIPTTMLFDHGRVKATSIGAVPKEIFKKWLQNSI